MRWVVIVLAFVVTTACSGSARTTGETPEERAATPSESTVEPLVGTWEQVQRCEDLVSAFEQAGLENWVLEFVAGNGYIPGVSDKDEIADPAHPCKGSVPREHSHFFTADGVFGSLDWKGKQVDDGTYEIVDDDTFAIGEVAFNYTIRGDTIMFDPVIPDCSPECFEAAWSVAVAYPGKSWERVS